MKKAFFTLLAATAIFLTGCRRAGESVTPGEYLPLVILSLQSGETAAQITRNLKIKEESYTGCVAAEIVGEGFAASSAALRARLKGAVAFPEIIVDLEACIPFKSGPNYELTEDSARIVEALTSATLDIAGVYTSRLRTYDCEKGVAADASLDYMRKVREGVVKFLRNPQPVFRMEAVQVDFQQCYT